MRSPRRADRPALYAWFGTRLAVVLVSLTASAIWAYGDLRDSFLGRWTQWDVDLFIEIAKYGYGGDPAKPPDAGLPAFFPGLPIALRAVHLVVPSWQLSALLISLVAGAVAMVAFARLGAYENPRMADGATPGTLRAGSGKGRFRKTRFGKAGFARARVGTGDPAGAGAPGGAAGTAPGTAGWTGPKAVLALLLSPYAVFLFAGYSETLFLAFALPAWLLVRQRRWELAALCAAGATCVRVTGLFLGIAMIVEFLVADRRWRVAPALVAPFAPLFGYTLYQWRRTGDWMAWQHAQQAGWGRSLVWPWQSFHTTWDAAFGPHNQFTNAFRVELLAAVIGVVLTAWLLWRRRWSESAYVGLQMASLLTSAFYLSIGRATLLWWPLWLAIGGLRRPGYLLLMAVFTPFMVAEVVIFTSGGWAG